jgi:ketosteroid isomerase-like protein
MGEYVRATEPEDLSRLFVELANAGDVEGLVSLYEPDAVLAFPDGQVTVGADAIRRVYANLLAGKPTFTQGDQHPALRLGDLALTSTRLAGGGATAEVARRQPDGGWRWILDRPNVVR